MSESQKRQREKAIRKQGDEAKYDLTCHPNPRIAAWAIANPEKAAQAVADGKVDELY